jgi:molecular chaperone GrpE
MSSEEELNVLHTNAGDEPRIVGDEQLALQAALRAAQQKNADLEAALRLMERHASMVTDRLTAVTSEASQQRRRLERDRDEAVKHANEALIAEIAPILDDLARARAAGARQGAEADPIVNGIRVVEERFVDVLRRFGATVFSTVGELFDPRRAEAFATRVEPSVPSGTVVEEHRRGVMLHERLIRAALVVVSASSDA